MDNAQWVKQALERFEVPLLRYAARITGSAERARDIVQETFLHLCQADRSHVENHLAAWLFRVCRNRALDMRRKETRVEPLLEDQQEQLVSLDPGPSALAERREGASQVAELIRALPEAQQEIIHLRFAGGLSYREISEVTGHSVSNVGVLIHTAVKRVRQSLVARDGEPGPMTVAEVSR